MSVALAEARMTQTELAAKTGRSTAYVNQLITGHKKPSPEWVGAICMWRPRASTASNSI